MWRVGGSRGRDIWVLMVDSLIVWQKLTHYGKAIIFQLKINCKSGNKFIEKIYSHVRKN